MDYAQLRWDSRFRTLYPDFRYLADWEQTSILHRVAVLGLDALVKHRRYCEDSKFKKQCDDAFDRKYPVNPNMCWATGRPFPSSPVPYYRPKNLDRW